MKTKITSTSSNSLDKIPHDFLELFTQYCSFQSVSTDTSFLPEIKKTVSWIESFIKQNRGKVTIIKGKVVNPMIIGEFFVDKKLETILIYGHYDVQPADKADGWSTDNPFELSEKHGKLIARGAVDNKGQNLIHLYSVAQLFKEKKLTYNVKFLLEGNEESGNCELPTVLKTHKKLLACDYVIVSDGEIAGKYPTLEASLRGGANIKIELTTGKTNLHSGIFGGGVPSSSLEMVKLLSKLKDEKTGKVLVPNFYKGLPKLTPEMISNNEKIGKIANPLKTSGTKKLELNLGFDFYTQTGLQPSIEISGIQTGYTGVGFANIVPSFAQARINIRTVPPQKHSEIIKEIVSFIKKNIDTKTTTLKITLDDHGEGCVLDINSPFAKKIKDTLEISHKKEVLYKYVGGSIPILKDFQTILKTKVISASLGNDDCNMHGIDENYSIDLIEKGLAFSTLLFGK